VRPKLADIYAERARRSYWEFVRQAWPIGEPRPFVAGFHIDAICECWEAVIAGDLRRLIINVPPRHGKSLLASVFGPAWAWINHPELSFLYASYAKELATRDSVRCRRVIESDWYRQRWGHVFELTGDQNLKARFDNDRGGVRLSTSVGGSTTGEGGDILVIDDAHKVEEAQSATQRSSVTDWFDFTLSTRLNDPARGAIVVIAQRLHEDDLCGHLLREGDWEHLCLPAEYEPSHPHPCARDPRTRAGELLWPERVGLAELKRLKTSLGSYGTAGQLQQRPAPDGGGIFKREWWRYYDPEEPLPFLEILVQSWDLAFTGNPDSDYVVGQAWAKIGPNRYLLHQIRRRMHFIESMAAIQEMSAWINERFPDRRGHAILIEEAANGAAMIDVLRQELSSIHPITPNGSKELRAQAVSPQIEAGNVWLPGAANAEGTGFDRSRTPQWVQDFIYEAESFPAASHDDQVDAMAQALMRLNRPAPRIRVVGGGPPRRRGLFAGF
jgi:predicted phage terminase large subunit-like protein